MEDYGNIAPVLTGLTKTDLAMAYFPNSTSKETARRNLQRWIKRNPELRENLQASGYRATQHYLSPRQVKIIYDMLGEP